MQRSAPQAARPASGLGMLKWWHGREMRETRAMARAPLLALTAAAVGVASMFIGWRMVLAAAAFYVLNVRVPDV